MKKKLRGLATASVLILMSLSSKAQSDAPDLSTALPPNLFSQNGWLEDTIGGGTNALDSAQCPGLKYGYNLPCIISTTYNVNKNNRWNDVKNSYTKFVRMGGTSADQNKIEKWQYLKFVDSVRAKGMEPVLQIPLNYGETGVHSTPAYDTTWAKTVITYINSTKARNVVYWTIGNEPDNSTHAGYGYNSNAFANTIATYIKNFSKAMRRAVPSVAIKIIGPELENWNPDPGYTMKKLVDSLLLPGGHSDITGKDPVTSKWYIDYFSFHYYGANGDNTAVNRDSVIRNIGSRYGLDSCLAYLGRKLAYANGLSGNNRGSSPVKMALTESNIDFQSISNDTWTSTKNRSFIAGQFWMEVAGVCAKHGVDFVCFWSALENSMGFMQADGTKNSTYYHFQMMADNFRNCDRYNTGADNNYYIKAYGAKSTAKIVVVITNQDTVTNASKLVTIRLDNTTPTATTWVRMDFGTITNPQDTCTVPSASTVLLVYDCNGTRSKKIIYKESGGSSGTPTTTTTSTSIVLADAGLDKGNSAGSCCTCTGVTIGTTGYPTGTTFTWTPTTALSSSTVSNPTASPCSTTTYTLTATLNGCTSTDDVKVTTNTNGYCCSRIGQFPIVEEGTSELLDNVPNPTDGKTIINFTLADNVITGEIRVTDIYGKVIETISVSKGNTNVEFNCSTCANGIYFYSLIVNEKMIGTKKMIIQKN